MTLPQSHRQETFWALTGFEITEEPVPLSDALRRFEKYDNNEANIKYQ